MARGALGILVGAIAWIAGFVILARLLYFVWPAYALHAKTYMDTQVYDFTPPMSGFNALFWFLAEIGAGGITVAIAGRREPSWILAALVALYLAFMHLYYVWDNFPWWYNLAVVIPAVPAVLLGGRLAGRSVRPAQSLKPLSESARTA